MELIDFLNTLYQDEKGHVYAPTKSRLTGGFVKNWYRWPEDEGWMAQDLEFLARDYDCFLSPVLYNSQDVQDFKLSNVVWCDFDDGIPAELGDFPQPTIRISSSGNSRKQHWYWRLASTCRDSNVLERWTKGLAYALGADKGCWNFSRVLRPPNTLNHKYNPSAPVSFLESSETVLDGFLLDMLPKPSELISEPSRGMFDWEPVESVSNLVFDYDLSSKFWDFFYADVEQGKRSEALTSVALSAVNAGCDRNAIMSLLYHADDRWGKFVGRRDREERLQAIVVYAEEKSRADSQGSRSTEKTDIGTLLDRGQDRNLLEGQRPVRLSEFVGFNYNIDWVINGLLHSQGLAIIASPPGVGKTQFSTNLLLSIGSGKSFLDWTVTRPRKVLFLSLEMTQPELKYYLDKMTAVLTEEEKKRVDDNCYFVSRQAFRLNSTTNQELLLHWIDEIKPEGIFIDSLSRCVGGDLEKGEIDAVFDFLNREVRDKRGCFIWFVHHNRKANFNQKQPKKLEDLYGSQYIGAYASSVIGLWKIDDRELEVNSLKVWFSKPFQTFRVERTDNLTFVKKVEKLPWA